MQDDKTILLIPSFNPDQKMIPLIEELLGEGFSRIVVIDDGSDEGCRGIFVEAKNLGCVVTRHEKNLGKGAALKTGIQTAIDTFGGGNAYVTLDSDGQHLPADVRRVVDTLREHPDSLILGTRDLGLPDVPKKSRFGNEITSVLFKLSTGISCPDTQTGLRGIPSSLEDLALNEDGKRYEYEMNFLLDTAGKIPFMFVPIQTVYLVKNKASHFSWLKDSILVYRRFLRYAGTSLISAIVDLVLFYLFFLTLPFSWAGLIFSATILARLCSGSINYLLNRYFSFRSKKPISRESLRYFILFICQMMVSAALMSLLSYILLPEMTAKVIVDICLFFVSYFIQKNWVFAKNEK